MLNAHIFFSSKDEFFQLEHARRNGSFNMTSYHYHNRFEIYYLVSGERNYFIRDRVYPVSKGTLVLIGANELHKTTGNEKGIHERILIEFTDDFLKEFSAITEIELYSVFNEVHVLQLEGIHKTTIENLMYKLVHESKAKEFGFGLAVKAIFIELLINIARCLSRTKVTNPEHPTQLHKKLSEITKYINANYMQPITLEELSKKFYMSKFYLCREFKQITGFSFSEYLNSVRIREATQLLLTTRLNISEIAEKIGYDSSTHFGRVFKDITGYAPLQYRKRNS